MSSAEAQQIIDLLRELVVIGIVGACAAIFAAIMTIVILITLSRY